MPLPEPQPSREGGGLFADLYELTMMRAYAALGMEAEAVFSVFVRKLPKERNFLIACGLDELLDEIERFHFSPDDIVYLRTLNLFPEDFLDELRRFRFAGDIFALPEGTPFFAGEPILEIRAPIGQAQALETLILNRIGLQTLLASKAWRVVNAAAGRRVMDFGARRAQGGDAALHGARAFAIAGIEGTSLLEAGARYGLPVAGTMAHSFVEAFSREEEAFDAFATLYPQTVLLVDTYDTLQGVGNAVRLAQKLGPERRPMGIRLDSGDLLALSLSARALLDDAGLGDMKIIASGGLDEAKIDALVKGGAPIDIFGVGTDMSVSADAPSLDISYKLTEYAGAGRMKLSAAKATLPGRKQVFRREADGVVTDDVIARVDELLPGTPLLVQVMRGGRRIAPPAVDLSVLRAAAARAIARLPPDLRALSPAPKPFPVAISPRLEADADALRARLSGAQGSALRTAL
ncbi:nicotinate phosphoribosyltransferase [Rhodoblastus acidophilus]|uniref:Nicotinate phosphoribosyltransferase n=1 Tax=Candidatus Rhodoblastus alkanivorans TaxID=2954117 RepID=A0ABS9Z6Y2_9HYPH|nr:nicotinate phosphoribosyltransferase [Candidatus Rhodoblastus alkanivorans]MCI4679603.1 nicotinate phosphoribosyltransferase [Candidatus Rhodoblastus alkanivorans]MCI4683428.1 nicotinate phosphoribosyltransferase [Candidatus Rhodoblastus alkanivorans]MDI4640738.1 nicotinate phosphoribosyltransferase [Rhodoblastus acidophilus]